MIEGNDVAAEKVHRAAEQEALAVEKVGPQANKLISPECDIESFTYYVVPADGVINKPCVDSVSAAARGAEISATVPETIDRDLRTLLIGSFVTNFVTGKPLYQIYNDIFERLPATDGLRFSDALLRSSSALSDYYNSADPIETKQNTERTARDILTDVKLEGGLASNYELYKASPDVFDSKEKRLIIGRYGINSLLTGQRIETPKNADDITSVELTHDKAPLHKPHTCADCGIGILPHALRVTTTVKPREGFDHHHYHPQCFSGNT